MASVTQRIRQIKQPRGGYLKPGDFIQTQLQGSSELNEKEISMHPWLVVR